jgi:peptidoglycan/LPS O-acetylase OafA/YrhL
MMLLSQLGLNNLTLQGILPALTYTSNYWEQWELSGYTTSHTWSLAIEEQFYLIWPFVLVIASRGRAFWILLAAVVSAPLLRTAIYVYNGQPAQLNAFHVNMDHLGMGCILAFVRAKLHSVPIYRRALNSSAFILVPIFIAITTYQQNHPSIHRTALLFLINLSIALCIDWAVTYHKSFVGRALNSRIMVSIGVLSYSIYIWQQPFTHLLNDNPPIFLSGPWRIIANPLLSLLCILACACVSYFLIERPSLRLREWLKPKADFTLQKDFNRQRMTITAPDPSSR